MVQGIKPPYMYWTRNIDCDSGHDAVDGWVATLMLGDKSLKFCRMCEGVLLNTMFNQWMLRRLQENTRIVHGYTGPIRKTPTVNHFLNREAAKKERKSQNV